jgi:hypothetical protein
MLGEGIEGLEIQKKQSYQLHYEAMAEKIFGLKVNYV